MRLTNKQIRLLEYLYQMRKFDKDIDCHRGYYRTAKSLHKKGLLDFTDNPYIGKDDDYFNAYLTKKGHEIILEILVTQKIKSALDSLFKYNISEYYYE